jgi:ribosomal protein S18 acetylase RimI-like enzyme
VYKAPPDALHQALQQSWYTVSAYDTGRLVGFGRVVSDGVLYAMIYDLIVIPSHQRRGIGSEILRSLVAR